jgi:hypothetical protein
MKLSRVFVSLFVALVFTTAASAGGSKPEDVFKGKVIVTASRLPLRFASANAFIAAVNKARTDKLWPKEEKGDQASWNLEYIAFFASPLNDNEVNVKFYEVTGGGQRFVAGDEQMTRERGTRIFASNITLGTPEFEVNKKYYMTEGRQLQRQGRVLGRRSQGQVALGSCQLSAISRQLRKMLALDGRARASLWSGLTADS